MMKSKRRPQIPHQQGLTLVELTIGMGLIVILVVGVIGIQSLLAQSEQFSIRTALTTENANSAIQSIVAELRTARPSEAGAFPLEEASDQQMTFYANVDEDDDVERVRYFLEGTQLKKGIIDPEGFPVSYPTGNETVRAVADFIRNGSDPLFTYYNQDWPTDTTNNPLLTPADLSQVKLVKVLVRVNAEPTEPQSELTLESSAQIRSLKENL